LDEETRGFIEKMLDGVIDLDLIRSVKWVKDEIPTSCARDLALGYALGTADALAIATVKFGIRKSCSAQDLKDIREMIKRRLPEFIEKITREIGT